LGVEQVVINLNCVAHRETRGDWLAVGIEARHAFVMLVGFDDVKLSPIKLRLGPDIKEGLEHAFVFKGCIVPVRGGGHTIVGVKARMNGKKVSISFLSENHQRSENVVDGNVGLVVLVPIDNDADAALGSFCVAYLVALVVGTDVVEEGFEDQAVHLSIPVLQPLNVGKIKPGPPRGAEGGIVALLVLTRGHHFRLPFVPAREGGGLGARVLAKEARGFDCS
jgi:hypothetical protein